MPLSRAALALALSSLLLPAAAAAQSTLKPGAPIAEGVSADLTEEGLGWVMTQAAGFLPPDLVIGSIPPQQVANLQDPLFGTNLCTIELEVHNLVVHTEIVEVRADGRPGRLDLVVDVWVWANDEAQQADADISTSGALCDIFDYDCNLYTEPARIQVTIPVTVTIGVNQDGEDALILEFGTISHNIRDALADKIHLTGCGIGEFNELLSTPPLNWNIFDLVIGGILPQIEDQITEVLAGLEETIATASSALWIEGETDLLETTLRYAIQPSAVHHVDEGLRLVLQGALDADPNRCVEAFVQDFPGSQFTDSDLPPMTATIPGTPDPYHAGLMMADDLANQAAYAAWRGGVMCFVIDDIPSLGLSTELLPLLLGAAGNDEESLAVQARLAELFPFGEAPMLLRTLPTQPPVIRWDGPNDVDVDASGLGLEFYVWIQDRFARLATVEIDIGAGVNVEIDEIGSLVLDVALDTAGLDPRVTYNEIAPDLNERLETNFPNFLSFAIDNFAGDLLSGMSFALPTLGGGDDDDSAGGDDDDSAGPELGFGLVSLDLMAAGESSSLLDFLAGYAMLGRTSGGVSSGGCGDCGGGGAGCEEGCGDCGGEGGACGELGSCQDVEGCLSEAGCSGSLEDTPDQVGCTGCATLTAERSLEGQWRVTLSEQGGSIERRKVVSTFKLRFHHVLLVFGPLVWASRRRRGSAEIA